MLAHRGDDVRERHRDFVSRGNPHYSAWDAPVLYATRPRALPYHHLHPVAEGKAGEYGFDFTPRTNARYRIFADVSPVATGKQEYVQADFGTVATAPAAIDRTETGAGARLLARAKGALK